jgi:preprotein translocase subunit SecA
MAKYLRYPSNMNTEVKDMTERYELTQEEVESIGIDEKRIRLLHSLTPENFSEFRDRVDAEILRERTIITFCEAS